MDKERDAACARSRKERGVVLLKSVKVGTTVYTWDNTPIRVEHQGVGSVTISRESEREIFGKIVKSRVRTTIAPDSEVRLKEKK